MGISWLGSKPNTRYPDDPDTMGIVTPNGNRIWLNDKDGSLKMYLYGSATIYAEGPVSINSKAQAYVNASKVIVNQGNNDGIININELTQKLNQLGVTIPIVSGSSRISGIWF